MNLALALLLQFASGLCANLVSMEDFVRNNTLLEKIRESSGKQSDQVLTGNLHRPTRPRRIFRVIPVKSNKGWTKKISVQPDSQDISEDVPIALIVAAKSDLRNLKMKNDSLTRIVPSQVKTNNNNTQNFETVNDSHNVNNNLFQNNGIENQIESNSRLPDNRIVQSDKKTASHVIDDPEEKVVDNEDLKDSNNENQHENDSIDKERLENEDHCDNVDVQEEKSKIIETNENVCDGIETKLHKSEMNADEIHFEIHKYLNESRKLRHNLHQKEFNVFFILKQ